MRTGSLEVHAVSKRFRSGTGQTTLTETLGRGLRLGRRRAESGSDEFWALRDVSFRIEPGEVIGLIGPNGSGKSTLFKIISRIIDPSLGEVRYRGRLASLLEVGTGFHPELSGRENVFLNGVILGISRERVNQKFDEIVAFAGVESFIDMPVKHYSSGMQVRLAFAVSAQLDPDILLIDEALAVGDQAFQEKCLAHTKKLAQSGKTVLIVSHDLKALARTCSRALLLAKGRVLADDKPYPVLDAYANYNERTYGGYQGPEIDGPTVTLLSSRADETRLKAGMRQPLHLTFTIALAAPWVQAEFGLLVSNSKGERLMTAKARLGDLGVGRWQVDCRMPEPRLAPGHYSLDVLFKRQEGAWRYFPTALHIEIATSDGDDPEIADKRDECGVIPDIIASARAMAIS